MNAFFASLSTWIVAGISIGIYGVGFFLAISIVRSSAKRDQAYHDLYTQMKRSKKSENAAESLECEGVICSKTLSGEEQKCRSCRHWSSFCASYSNYSDGELCVKSICENPESKKEFSMTLSTDTCDQWEHITGKYDI